MVKKDLGVSLQPADCTRFGRVLLGMVRFCELIAYKVCTVKFAEFVSRLDLGIVAAKVGGSPFMS